MNEEERLKILREEIIERIKDSKPFTVIIHDESRDLNNSKSRATLQMAKYVQEHLDLMKSRRKII